MLLFLVRCRIFCRWEREREREETKTNCYIAPKLLLLTIPPHDIFKFRLYNFSSLTRCKQSVFARGPPGFLRPQFSICRHLQDSTKMPQDCSLQDCHATAWISRAHLHISFHNALTFLLNYVTASAYLQGASCAEKSLNDGSVKGQYATLVDFHQFPCSMVHLSDFLSCPFWKGPEYLGTLSRNLFLWIDLKFIFKKFYSSEVFFLTFAFIGW